MLLVGCLPRQVEQWSKLKGSESARVADLRTTLKEVYGTLRFQAVTLSFNAQKVRHQYGIIEKCPDSLKEF